MILEQVNKSVARLRAINQIDLPELIVALDDSIAEVSQGGYTDASDAFGQLQDGLNSLTRILKELLTIRNFIGEMGDS